MAENTVFVPAMAAQLTLGIWLPEWAGPAPWQTASASIASVNIWQYGDAGDVRGILTADVPDNYTPTSVLGDLNNDLRVDLADWAAFKANVGRDTSALAIEQRRRVGDLNRRGSVNLDDFTAFRSIFRSVITDGSASAVRSLIPEPAALSMMVVSLLLPTMIRTTDRRPGTPRHREST